MKKYIIVLPIILLFWACGDTVGPAVDNTKEIRVGNYVNDEIPVYVSTVDGYIPVAYAEVLSVDVEGDDIFFVFKNEESAIDISLVGKGDLIIVRPSFNGFGYGIDVMNAANKDRLCEEYKSLPDPSIRSFFACGE